MTASLTRVIIKRWFGIIFKANLAQQWLKRRINKSSDYKITNIKKKFNSIDIKYDCKCLKVWFIVIYTMLGFITHKGQMLCYLVFSFLIVVTLKFQMLASMIFWNVCKYFILRDSRRALPWFCAHVRWHRGNHPPLKRNVVLKRICLCLCISHCLYLSLWDEITAFVRWQVVPWCC